MSKNEQDMINICFKGLSPKDMVNINGVAYGNGSIVELPVKHGEAYIKTGLAFAVNTDDDYKEAKATQALLRKNEKTRKEILSKAQNSNLEKDLTDLKINAKKGGVK